MKRIKSFFLANFHRPFILLAAIFLIIYFVVIEPWGKDKPLFENSIPDKRHSSGIIINYADSSKPLEESSRQKRLTEEKKQAVFLMNRDSIRRETMLNCLRAADMVAQKSGLTRAKEIAVFLKNMSILARPEENGIRPIDSTNKSFLGFVVVLPDDTLPPIGWKRAVENNRGINYFPLPNNCIIVEKEDIGTEKIAGLMLLYQGSRAKIEDIIDYKNAEFYLSEDQKAHELISDVLLALGGKAYANLLKQETERIHLRSDSSKYEIWPARIKYSDTLGAIFSAGSNFEHDFIGKLFWVHATFNFIENNQALSKEEKYQKKISFMDNIYYYRKR